MSWFEAQHAGFPKDGPMTPHAPNTPQHDFDFFFGQWQVRHRRLRERLKAVEQAIGTEFEDDEYTFNLCSGTTINVNEIVEAVRLASDDFAEIEVVRREPHMLWNSYPQLFEGDNALSTERVAKETLKFSLGSTERFEAKFGWAPSKETATKVTETARQILTKIRR